MDFFNRLSKSSKGKRNSAAPRNGAISSSQSEDSLSTSSIEYAKEKNDNFMAKITEIVEEDAQGLDDQIEQTASTIYAYLDSRKLFGDAQPETPNRSSVAIRRYDRFQVQSAIESADFTQAALGLDANVLISLDSPVVTSLAMMIPNHAQEIQLESGITLQVFQDLAQCVRARHDQPHVFTQKEKLLLTWGDSPQAACENTFKLQNSILEVVWNDDKEVKNPKTPSGLQLGDIEGDGEVPDLEMLSTPPKRKRNMHVPINVAICWLLILFLFGIMVRTLLIQFLYDGSYLRFTLITYYPVTFFMSIFFYLCIIGSLAQIIGPMSQLKENSFAYSAIAPIRTRSTLPHITVQCPVYKESLSGVISKTIDSVAKAMRRYELQGGTCNLLMCDDRMQLVGHESAQFRKQYYRDNNIGWVARPGHNVDGFIRAGKFKKASNMNFALSLSMAVEEELEKVVRGPEWTREDEQMAYDHILAKVLEANPRAQAAGNIRVGDLILLIDSDTRVPADCLIDAASEFEQSPDLAILQHACGVMQVTHDYFENGITWFTDYIYRSIRLCAAGGDIAPFVGHNAFLRWSAIQSIAEPDSTGTLKYWSEDHVSEDFEMALKLQGRGFSLRLAGYSEGGFEEGVSLTIFDELARWEKYGYGCSELIFNPFRYWITRSPFTKTFRAFVTSGLPGFGKFTILAYMGTYYAIGAIWIVVLANYFVTGWYAQNLDQAYLTSFKVFLSLVVVFNGLCPLAHSIVRSRMGDETFLRSAYESFKWMLFFVIFFGGISLHISRALVCHLFSINMEWGATSKELDNSDFFNEIQRIFKAFWKTYVFCLFVCAGMIYLAYFAPLQWRISGLNSCLPLAWSMIGHMLMPIVLNPQVFKL